MDPCHDPKESYPLSWISETVELPCKKTVNNDIERVLDISWQPSPLNSNLSVPVILSPQCYPDLECRRNMEDPTSMEKMCLAKLDDGKEDCDKYPCTCAKNDYREWYNANDCTERFWNPSCDRETGLYGPVQLKAATGFNGEPHRGEAGDNRWCSDPAGNRLFGQELVGWDISDMTCSCSRKHWELKQNKQVIDEVGDWSLEGRSDVSLHCDEIGNYERLQCDMGRCWCINNKTGEAMSLVLPESLLHLLPCYTGFTNQVEVGKQYLRRCESRVIGVQHVDQWLQKHGTHWKRTAGIKCDIDGSFNPVHCDDTMCYCKDKNDKTIVSVNQEREDQMKCRCARDKDAGLTNLKCDGAGNYKLDQKVGKEEYCVDEEDGWRTSGIAPPQEDLPCCIFQDPDCTGGDCNYPWMDSCKNPTIINWNGFQTTDCGRKAQCKKGAAINAIQENWTCKKSDDTCNDLLKQCIPT